jgi:hypothetical protein
MIRKPLGYTQAATSACYAHLAADPVKVAADEIARRSPSRCSRRRLPLGVTASGINAITKPARINQYTRSRRDFLMFSMPLDFAGRELM